MVIIIEIFADESHQLIGGTSIHKIKVSKQESIKKLDAYRNSEIRFRGTFRRICHFH